MLMLLLLMLLMLLLMLLLNGTAADTAADVLLPVMVWVGGLPILIAATYVAPGFLVRFRRVVMGFAQTLQVSNVEEESDVATMRYLVICHRRGGRAITVVEAHRA